ncbi:MAG: TonB-dependent receptor [Spongiibacteraceae bacterium]
MINFRLPHTAASVVVLAALSPSLFAADTLAANTTSKSASKSSAEEVIVTARFREENIQDVPASISVLSGDKLEATGTASFDQLIKLQPSVQYISSNPRNTAVTIRGLGSVIGLTNDGIEPGVGIYVDGVFFARPGSAATDLLDIDRIEVLRGPQGTLFGKNTTAGALNILTNAPSFDDKLKLETSLGNLGFRQFKASVNGGLVDDVVAGRLSYGETRRDGNIHNVTTGEDQNDIKNKAVRGQLLIKPADSVNVRLSADYSKIDPDSAQTQVFVRYGATQRSAASQFPALAAAFNYAPASTNPYDRLADVNSPLEAKQILKGISATVDWDLGDVTLTSITAKRKWDWTPQNDRDYTALSIRTKSNNNSEQDQKSQELRLTSNGDNALDWIVGLYWFNQNVETNGIEQWGSDAARWLIGTTTGTPAVAVPTNLLDGYQANTHVLSDTTSKAIYGQFTYDITDRLHVTPGLRFTSEEKSGDFTQVVSGGLSTTTSALVSAKNGIARNQHYEAGFTDKKLTGQVSLAYDLSSNYLAYTTLARGFKSGGINAAGIPTDAAGNPALVSAEIDPEQTTTLELGLKSQLFDGAATANIAVYSTRVDDYQANVVDSGPGALRGYLANIDRVTVNGVELDTAFRLSNSLTAYAALAYTDAKYDSFKNGPPPLEYLTSTTAAYDLSGEKLPGVSKWAGSLGAEYNYLGSFFSARGDYYFGTDVSFRSNWNSDASVSKYAEIAGYGLVNFRTGFKADNGTDVTLFVRNAFDKEYLNFVSIQAGNSGAIYGQPGDERTYGVTIKTEF